MSPKVLQCLFGRLLELGACPCQDAVPGKVRPPRLVPWDATRVPLLGPLPGSAAPQQSLLGGARAGMRVPHPTHCQRRLSNLAGSSGSLRPTQFHAPIRDKSSSINTSVPFSFPSLGALDTSSVPRCRPGRPARSHMSPVRWGEGQEGRPISILGATEGIFPSPHRPKFGS